MSASDFFTSKPESSEDIKLADDDGFLKNPVTGGTDWYHSSHSAGTIFSDDWLEKNSTFLGTYHTADPSETLSSGYLHVNKIKMKNPLVVSEHHDNNNTSMDDTGEHFSRGQFLSIGQLVRHYAKKYGSKVLPQYGDPNDPDSERKFYEQQTISNTALRKDWEDRVNQLKENRKTDPWAVDNQDDINYLPAEPAYDTRHFSKDYLSNFSQKQRLYVLRRGLILDGYDGAIFHYTSQKNPTIFVIKPSSQIVPQKVISQNSSKDLLDTLNIDKSPISSLKNGLSMYIRKNDLFEAEKARGLKRSN